MIPCLKVDDMAFMLQAPELLHVSNISSMFRQIRDCWINKTERGLIMRVKRFIE